MQSLLVQLRSLPSDRLLMLPGSYSKTSIKLLRDTQEASHHCRLGLDNVSVLILDLGDVVAPACARNVDEQRSLGNMYAGTYTTAGAVSEVVSITRVRSIEIFGSRELGREIAFWIEVGCVVVVVFVKMYGP